MDIGAISSAISSLKAAGNIAQAMIDLRDAQAFQTKAIELMREIISAQTNAISAKQAQSDLIDQIRELKDALSEKEHWDTEKNRYALHDFGSGTFAYVLKPDRANGESHHRLCAKCYQDGKKVS